jgi:hypothetical protein
LRVVRLGVITAIAAAPTLAMPAAEALPTGVSAMVVGVAQDGGVPHLGCV